MAPIDKKVRKMGFTVKEKISEYGEKKRKTKIF